MRVVSLFPLRGRDNILSPDVFINLISCKTKGVDGAGLSVNLHMENRTSYLRPSCDM